MILRELTLDDNPECGIHAISFVDKPAIKTEFEYFADKKLPFFKFYASPPLILNSHEFCKHKVSKNDGGLGVGYYHINEINNEWSTDPSTELIMDNIGKNWFTTFDGSNARVDGAIYNCRHMLLRASSLKEIPRSAIDRAITKGFWKKGIDFEDEEMYFNFEISNPEKREVAGVVLRSGQMIYRADIAGKGSGYVYFSRDTVRKLKEKYGWNRTITFSHRDEITGEAILLDSWLDEREENSPPCTEWSLKYKILGNKLWEQIKTEKVRGFSAELLMQIS